MLRPGELCALLREDVVIPNSLSLGGPYITVRIANPKNKRHFGRQQFVVIQHPNSVSWVTWVVSCAKPDAQLWPGSTQEFRNMFRLALTKLKLQHCRFSPASLRAGGASFFSHTGMELGKVRLLGRWAAEASLQHYVQVATAEQVLPKLPEKVSRRLLTVTHAGLTFCHNRTAACNTFQSSIAHRA